MQDKTADDFRMISVRFDEGRCSVISWGKNVAWSDKRWGQGGDSKSKIGKRGQGVA